MDFFTSVDELEARADTAKWDELEAYFRSICVDKAGEELAGRIAEIVLTPYTTALSAALTRAVATAVQEEAMAVYFEYDIDNDWAGNFFICPEYSPRSTEDDDWACDWLDVIEGPTLPEFTTLFDQAFLENERAVATDIYLIARTVAAFGRCVESVRDEALTNGIAVCLAFHDQDPITRIVEPEETRV